MKMKKLLLSFFALSALCFSVQAQIIPSVVFRERFDPTSGPDSVTTYNTNALLNSTWNDTNQLWVSPGFSYHTRIVPFDSVIFETNSFSTVGNIFVRLKFNHICKIFSGQRGYIQASNNGGQTWVNVTSVHYLGASPQFPGNGYFNELSYPAAGVQPYWGGVSQVSPPPVMPTNQWWAEEIFNLSPILGGTNGYPNCKIRFIAAHAVNVPINPAGWYVDNILVEAAPCELFPPTFTYNNPAPFSFNKPVGARYMASQAVNIKVRDQGAGVKKDSITVTYRVNGGPWTNGVMSPASTTGPACPDSTSFTFTWNNIALFDTIDWYITVKDCACPNITRDPLITANPNYYTFWRDVAPPAICGPTFPNSFPLVISTLPYSEGFEGSQWVAGSGAGNTGVVHRGSFPTDNPPNGLNWTVSPNQVTTGFAWSIRTGGTATAQTGPSGANNIFGGTKYVYAEASQGNASAQNPIFTQLITPCIDLSTVSCAALEFYYHMYGSDIDRLRIDVDTGSATSKYVNAIATFIGQQQTSETQPYKRAFISLEQFSGRIIRIRFSARKNTVVANDKNDIAIDDIRVYVPTPYDAEINALQTPINGYCSYSNAEDIKVCFQNLGCNTLTSVPFGFKVEYTQTGATTPTSTTIIRDTLLGNFPTGKDTCYTFNPKANLSQFGTYRVWAWTAVAGDTVRTNDTIGPFFVEHRQPINTFPYQFNFDGPSTISGNGTSGNSGTIGTDDWEQIPNPSAGGFAFHVMTGKTPTVNTGPRNDYTGNGNYIYTEANFGTAPVNALFVSKCISLGSMTNPTFEFKYHMFGADIGLVRVQAVLSGTNNWVNVPNALINPPQQTASVQQWRVFTVDLSAYANTTIKLRIVAQKGQNGFSADIGIDDIRIYDRIANDAGILDIIQPPQRINMMQTPPQVPQFVIRNYGTATLTSVPVSYTVTPLCGPNAGVGTTYTATYTGSIAPNAQVTFTLPTAPVWPQGSFEICATTNLTGDTYTLNNSWCKESVGWNQIAVQTGFIETFDPCAQGNSSGFWVNGDYRTFTLGTPPEGASSPPRSMTTRLFGNNFNNYAIYSNTNEYLNGPQFIGFDTIVGAELWFRQRYNFGTGGVGLIERQVGNNWEVLGFEDTDNLVGFNWYQTANITSLGGSPGWTGNSSGLQGATSQGWITSRWPLSILNFSSAPFIFRFRQFGGGGGGEGWSVDNVEIRIPPQNSAAPVDIDSESYFLVPDITNTLRVRIQNTGAKRLDSCMVTYRVSPTSPWSTPQKVVFSPPLGRGAISGWILFDQKWVNPASGTYNVCVATFQPNGKQDNFTPDDTLCKNLIVLDKIVFPSNDTAASYCNNFETPGLVDWIALNTFNKQGLVSWQKGTPNQAPILGANSAPNAWMTNLSNNYKMRDSSSLFTPVFVIDSGQTYAFSFKHNFRTELFHDGGTVDVTYDGGASWNTVGSLLPNGLWYNTTHVTSLDILKPGWSGDAQGWIDAKINIAFDSARSVIFRFRFASDQSLEFSGWAIDDFCFKKTNRDPDQFIGIDEPVVSDLIGVGNIIPNPSTGSTEIHYVMNSPKDVKMTIYNMFGQQLYNHRQASTSGINTLNFDVTGWAAGMYIVTIEVEGEIITKKLMVK